MIKIVRETRELTDDEISIIKRYSSGLYKHLNSQADEYLSGIPTDSVVFSKSGESLYNLVNESDTRFDTLYRIEKVDGFKVDEYNTVVESPYKKGSIIKWGLRSTSTSEKFIARAARKGDENLPFVGGNWGSKIVFRLKNEYGLDISSLSNYKYQ